MTKVRIIGGGLTGVLAAFEAHRLGARDIELHERFDQLGGVALPRRAYGAELRDGCIYFGPEGDPIRTILETHGAAFEDFENRFGSVSPGGTSIEDFGGPVLPSRGIALRGPIGESLADRIGAYPQEIAAALERYCQWHLGADLTGVHESAAIPLAINRVYPAGADVADLAEKKHADPLHDELYAIPRTLWGRTNNLTASLPRDGFAALFAHCRRALEGLGVAIFDTSLVSPRQAMAENAAGDVLVWAANPTPLFKVAGLPTPRLVRKSFTTWVFKVANAGPLPFYVQNFTAEGAIFRVYLYESGGQSLAAAECVAEPDGHDLRGEIRRLMAGFEGAGIEIGEQVGVSVQPRWIYHSLEAIHGLADLRASFRTTMGAAFVDGAWEPYSKAEKLSQVNAGLAAALQGGLRTASAA